MAVIDLAVGNVPLKGDTNGTSQVGLFDPTGIPAVLLDMGFAATPSGVVQSGVNDGVNARTMRVDRFGTSTNMINAVIWEQYEGTTQNTQRWTNAATTFVGAQTSSGYNLNSTNLTTASAVNVNVSKKRILRTARNPIHFHSRRRISNYANSVSDFGLSDGVTGVTQIANGAYFQMTAASVLQGVVTTGSTDAAVPLTWQGGNAFDLNKFYVWDILVDDDSITFLVQDTSTGRIVANGVFRAPTGAARMLVGTHFAAFERLFNLVTPPATAPVHVSTMTFLGFVDMVPGKPWGEVLATNSFSSAIHPTTFAQAAAYANSAEPASATLSNTAAGYATLGGKFQFQVVAGAATDYLLFAFQVPAPLTFVCKRITIDLWNTVVASAATPTLLHWGAVANMPSASLAAGGTSMRRGIGAQSVPVGTAPGANVPQISQSFTGHVTEGGLFFGIALRMPVGTLTATQVLAGYIDIDGYFE